MSYSAPKSTLTWKLYVLFCVLMFLMHVATVWILYVFVYQNAYNLGYQYVPQDPEFGRWYFKLAASLFMGVATFFGVAELFLPFRKVNKKWWIAHLVNIVLGLGSAMLIPLCLPLLLMWLKPEFRQSFESISTESSGK